MTDAGFWDLLENASYDRVDEKLLEKLLPFLNYSSKVFIFDKILHGELDWHFLSHLMRYVKISDAILETAVIDGVLDEGVLKLVREFRSEQNKRMKKCAYCGEYSPEGTTFCLVCGKKFVEEQDGGITKA